MKLRIFAGVVLLVGIMFAVIGCGPGSGTAKTEGHKTNKEGTTEVPPIVAPVPK